jgi:hypothetical protein
VQVLCHASLDKRGNPHIATGPDEVIRRFRGVEFEHNPPSTFFDTNPRIGEEVFVTGDSLDLAFVIADRMARYGSLETRMIVATGCLKRIDGVVGAVEDFERKVELLANLGRRDFVFVYPRRNVTAAIRGKLEYLERERGAELRAIDSLNDVKFLWTGVEAARRARWRRIRRLAAGILVLVAALFIYRHGDPRRIITIAMPAPPVVTEPDPFDPKKSIWTSGEHGAYHTIFCPPVPAALTRISIFGYQCVSTAGTVENIGWVLKFPTSIGLVQLDVLLEEAGRHGEEFWKKIRIIRRDVACEGLWLVTRKYDRQKFEQDGRDAARRIRFVLPPVGSGAAATFSFLQRHEPEFFGRVREPNKRYVPNGTAAIDEAAFDAEAVAFIVQYATPENENIRLIMAKGLHVIPLTGWRILNIRQHGERVYKEKTFTLESGGVFDVLDIFATQVKTACTPVVMITGEPATISNPEARGDHEDLIAKVAKLPTEILVPPRNRIAEIVAYFRAWISDMFD